MVYIKCDRCNHWEGHVGISCPVKDCICKGYFKKMRIKDIDFCLICCSKLRNKFGSRYTCSNSCRQKAHYGDIMIRRMIRTKFDPVYHAMDIGLLKMITRKVAVEC